MLDRVKTFIETNKYLVLAIMFTIAFVVNFTVVKQERDGYETAINKLVTSAETMREVSKTDPGSKYLVLQTESQITQLKNESMWINVVYVFFMGLIGTIACVLFSTLAQWGYTNVPFTKKLLNPDNVINDKDTDIYSHVLSAVYVGQAIIIAVCIYVSFGV